MLFIFSCSFVILEFIRLWAHSRNAHQINRPSSIVRCPTFDRNAWIRELQDLIVGFPLRSSCGFCCWSADFHKISMFFFLLLLYLSSSSLLFFCVVYSLLLLSCLFCHTFSLLKWYRPLSVARSLFHWCFCEWSTFLFRPILATASNNNNASFRCLGRSEWTLRKRILL